MGTVKDTEAGNSIAISAAVSMPGLRGTDKWEQWDSEPEKSRWESLTDGQQQAETVLSMSFPAVHVPNLFEWRKRQFRRLRKPLDNEAGYWRAMVKKFRIEALQHPEYVHPSNRTFPQLVAIWIDDATVADTEVMNQSPNAVSANKLPRGRLKELCVKWREKFPGTTDGSEGTRACDLAQMMRDQELELQEMEVGTIAANIRSVDQQQRNRTT